MKKALRKRTVYKILWDNKPSKMISPWQVKEIRLS
jgi:hypothetical protein